MNISYGKPSEDEMGELIARMPDNDLQKATRSTVAQMAYWRLPVDRMNRYKKPLDIMEEVCPSLSFEYPVENEEPRSKPSMTDVMYSDTRQAIAFEVKWTEPRYDSVAVWLDKGRDIDHRKRVLNCWLNMIKPYVNNMITIDLLTDLPYQMIHRIASACSFEKQKATVVYQCFKDKKHGHAHIQTDLASFYALVLPKETLQLFYHGITLTETDDYRRLARDTKKKSIPVTASLVKAALISRILFEFEESTPVKIT